MDQRDRRRAEMGLHRRERSDDRRAGGLHLCRHGMADLLQHQRPAGLGGLAQGVAVDRPVDVRGEVELRPVDGVPIGRVQFHELIDAGLGVLGRAPRDLVAGAQVPQVFHQQDEGVVVVDLGRVDHGERHAGGCRSVPVEEDFAAVDAEPQADLAVLLRCRPELDNQGLRTVAAPVGEVQALQFGEQAVDLAEALRAEGRDLCVHTVGLQPSRQPGGRDGVEGTGRGGVGHLRDASHSGPSPLVREGRNAAPYSELNLK